MKLLPLTLPLLNLKRNYPRFTRTVSNPRTTACFCMAFTFSAASLSALTFSCVCRPGKADDFRHCILNLMFTCPKYANMCGIIRVSCTKTRYVMCMIHGYTHTHQKTCSCKQVVGNATLNKQFWIHVASKNIATWIITYISKRYSIGIEGMTSSARPIPQVTAVTLIPFLSSRLSWLWVACQLLEWHKLSLQSES